MEFASCLLASAGNDASIKIWDIFRSKECIMSVKYHTKAIREIQWNKDSSSILSCSYDKTVKLIDVETGSLIHDFKHDNYALAIQYHPNNDNLFITGGAFPTILCWDIRAATGISEYKNLVGHIQSLEFINNGKQFISSSDITKRNSLDRSIIVWDFDSRVQLSNQVYIEAYTCPCIRAHPSGNNFVAQSNGGYIAIFSTISPYKMNRGMRYQGHKVNGNNINCSFSYDGEFLATGSAEGCIYYYAKSTKIARVLRPHTKVCTDAVFHPQIPYLTATCGWDKNVCILE